MRLRHNLFPQAGTRPAAQDPEPRSGGVGVGVGGGWGGQTLWKAQRGARGFRITEWDTFGGVLLSRLKNVIRAREQAQPTARFPVDRYMLCRHQMMATSSPAQRHQEVL